MPKSRLNEGQARRRRYAVLLITVLALLASMAVGLGKLLYETSTQQVGFRDLTYWSAAQVDREFWRFLDTLDRIAQPDSAVTQDDVTLRLDILWSRIDLFDGGDVGERLAAIEGTRQTIEALSATLRDIEPRLEGMARDRTAISDIRARLEIHIVPVFQMAKRVNLAEQAQAARFRYRTIQTYYLLLLLLLGGLAGGIALIVQLFREIRTTGRLLAAANTAEYEARTTAQRLSAVLNNSVVGIITIDARGIVTSLNPAAEKLFGYTADQVITHNVSMLMPDILRHAHDGYLQRYSETGLATVLGRPVESTGRRADGSTIPIEISAGEMWVEGEKNFVGFTVDITERKLAEDAQKASERRFRDIADVAADWIWETDKEHRYTFVSDQVEKNTGIAAKKLFGAPLLNRAWAGDLQSQWDRFDRQVAARQPFRDVLLRIPGGNSEIRTVRISGKPVLDADGNFSGYRGAGTDLTAQIAAVTEAAQKSSLLHATFDNMSEGINVLDADGNVAAFNSRFLELFDLPAEEIKIGMSFDDIVHLHVNRGNSGVGDNCDQSLQLIEQLRCALRGGEIVRFDGTIIETRSSPLPDGGRVITYVDITERKKIEEEYRQAQKMEAIGRLTGGVAHEFNNLLTAIGGYAHLLMRQPEDPNTVREWSHNIISAADQAAGLTRQLLAFSRKQDLEPRIVSVNDVLSETEALLRPTMGAAIIMDFEHSEDNLFVRVDPGQLSQALLNFAINAQDAMPSGGRLTIASSIAELDQAALTGFDQAAPGKHVAISVSDTGTGIDEKTMAEIFEPFFTTKLLGEGTGLGLSMVYGMVQQSHGVVTVDSAPGQGATFTIYLPLVEQPAEAAPIDDEGGLATSGIETILVAEDETPVRELARIALEGLGYTVLTAENGDKAVRAFQDCDGAVHLLLTDIKMPGMNGRELAGKLCAQSPDLKVLYMTGYDGIATEFGKISRQALLMKPFDPQDLGQIVRNLLDGTYETQAA